MTETFEDTRLFSTSCDLNFCYRVVTAKSDLFSGPEWCTVLLSNRSTQVFVGLNGGLDLLH